MAVAAAPAAAAVAAATAVAAKRGQKRAAARATHYHKRVRADRPSPFDLDEFAALLTHLGVGFEGYFRLPRGLFDKVLDDIRPRLLTAHPEQGGRACGHAITPEHRLAVALRFFAGALWQDIVVGLRPVSKAEVFKSVWLVVDAVNNEYAGKWGYPQPGADAPRHELEAAATKYSYLEARFREKSPMGCMHGVIGAVDGCILRVHSPGRAVDNPADHWCERKKTYGMLLMATADADMIIREWSALIHLHNTRRASRQPLLIEAGHQVRFKGGRLQWGLAQRRASPGGASSVDMVWADAPKLDEHGRLTELMGSLKQAFQSGGAAPVAPQPPGARTAADRAAMLEDSIAGAGVCRPRKA